jgi:phosphodiesterase/alkaline phosphatase D-like protein
MADQVGRPGRFSRRTLLSAAGAALVSADLAATARAGVLVDQRFDRMRDRNGWGSRWYARHFSLVFDVHRGRGRLHLPAGLRSTAPSQPIPVFLLDHECRDGTHELHFQVTHAGLRPGIALHRRDAFHYLAVTVEQRRIVLASYSRTERHELAYAHVAGLDTDPHVLRVTVSGRALRAGLWRAGHRPSMQLAARLPIAAGGTPGVLLVAPADRQPGSLLVSRYLLSARRFGSTTPRAALLVTGTPQANGDEITVGLRAACDVPSSIQFEWSSDPSFSGAVARSAVHRPGPPFSARDQVVLADAGPVYWRARFVATGSRAVGLSRTQRYTPQLGSGRLVMGAASCAHLWQQPAYNGLGRLLDVAPAPPALLVYQGDLGYAGNSRFSSYNEAPDFYFERFTRTLSDPHFEAVRKRGPVGFTGDDHDYTQQNNAPPSRFPTWSLPLWNHVHADPSTLGYSDVRFGDVHCFTLDGRRYADPVEQPDTPAKTKLGTTQRAWLESRLATTDASLVVVFSADIFASRPNADCFLFGWPHEYRRLMTAFMDAQLRGVRVVVLSGDAHGLRIHHHPDPAARPRTAGLSIVEFVCSGLSPRSWEPATADDGTLDPQRSVMQHRGLGMIDIDPPGTPGRSVTLRAISGEEGGPDDLFPPLVLDYAPTPDSSLQLRPPPAAPRHFERGVPE